MATPVLSVRPVVLEGAHVRLEPMQASHVDALMAAGEPEEIWRYLPARPRTREDFERWAAAALTAREAGTELPFVTVERASGEVVGSTRFLAISPRDRRLEIGWTWLHPR
ncbi:MAG TPA: GNAT family N-acetyltransferase, partial [Dehalococcoidia bacterium]|nr:GNAT family N-acetyltransferase [Dehalococcoidia bacterium]